MPCSTHQLFHQPSNQGLRYVTWLRRGLGWLGPGREQSRVLAKGTAAAAGALVRQLSAGAKSGDYAALVAYLRGLAPSALDQQLRAMQARSMAQEKASLGICGEEC